MNARKTSAIMESLAHTAVLLLCFMFYSPYDQIIFIYGLGWAIWRIVKLGEIINPDVA